MKNTNSKNVFSRFGAWLKEKVRKFFVTLKKNPQYIPIASLCAAFLVYSLNLTHISDTTAKIQRNNMGLAAFITMLFMILSFVCMLSAFPKRKKPKISMVIIMTVLYASVIAADIIYLSAINYSFAPDYWSTLAYEDKNYILIAYDTIIAHIILTAVTIVLVLAEPLIAKLLKKINTSIDVEATDNIATIDISDED